MRKATIKELIARLEKDGLLDDNDVEGGGTDGQAGVDKGQEPDRSPAVDNGDHIDPEYEELKRFIKRVRHALEYLTIDEIQRFVVPGFWEGKSVDEVVGEIKEDRDLTPGPS